MSKFHVNPETGAVGKCRSFLGRCPFGGDEAHFGSKEEAYNASVANLAQQYGSFTTHSATKRYEEKVLDPAVDAEAKRSLLKEYLDTHDEEVQFALQDNSISGDGREPETTLAHATPELIEAALAKVKIWQEAASYNGLSDVFVALDEATETARHEAAFREYQATAPRLLSEEEIMDVYGDDPAKAQGLRQMQEEVVAAERYRAAQAAYQADPEHNRGKLDDTSNDPKPLMATEGRTFLTGEKPWSDEKISFKDLNLANAGDYEDMDEETWTTGDPVLAASAQRLAARLEGFNLTRKDAELENIIEDLRYADRPYEYHDLLERTYDWADQNRVWIDQ